MASTTWMDTICTANQADFRKPNADSNHVKEASSRGT